jgi:hypothetical protein
MTKKSKYDMPAVQNFAFGGIANPVQRAMLRGSDKQYLSDRQKELDAFEEQRLAYNDQLTKWQTEVYNPYKAQADAYNTAAQRYNEEVYNPYKTQYDTYLKSIEAYNAGPRTEDYSGPAAPTLTREFGMTAPATPTMFDRTAPVLPFKEEEVQARQQLAAERAREDASNRSVAIDVVSDPDKFNFGSMSVSNRFMAKGGEVTDDSDDRAASAIIKDFEAYGYTKEEIMELADKVAQAGRGGDELLAYLSPESVEFLKSKGGSGTINPITGLPEFKGGVIGKIVGAIKRVFNPRSAAAPAAVAEPVAATPATTGPSAAELAKQLDDANKAREALATKNALELTTLKEQQAAALKAQQEASTAAQQLAIQNALKADADARAKAALPISNVINQTSGPGGLTGALALSLMYRSTQGGVPTAELEKYGGYSAVSKAAAAAGFNPTPKWIDSYEKSMKMPESEYTKRNKLFFSPGGGGYNNPDAGSWDGITPGGGYVPLPKAALTALPSIGTTQKTTNVTSLPANFSTIGASSGIGKIDLGGPLDVGWSRYLDKERDDERKKTPVTGSMFGDTGQRTDITSEQIPVTQPTLYQTKGVGQVGQVGAVGDVGGINITGPASPIFGTSPISRGGAATDPNSYFGLSQTSNPGINAGTTALGPSSLPVAGAVNTLNTIGSNPNLSPTMLGGANNAGFFTDRLGNKIVAPGMGPLKPPGFAKGGDIDLQALLAQNTETLSDEKPEETINTNPVGTAQKYLADISSAGKPSPTRQSIKRTKTSAGGGATAEKAMQLAYEDLAKGDLGSMKDRPPAMKNTESARSQMEELARVYQMKIRSAQNAAKGLSADTFGAPTLEGPTLTKGSLTKKRFKEGGEAKKADAESAQEPGIFGVSDYATKASARMFPEQMGQDDQRDAARHMLAAAVLAKKTGPGTAIFLGKAHERMSNPESFFSMLGIGKPRDDYEMDVHNNKLGADLGSRTTSQEELEKLVRAMAMQSQNKQVEGKPWTMSKEQMKNRKGQITTQPPEYRAEGSPVEGELSQEEIDAASKPAFVTPKSGKGRKQGEISKQLKSGDAYVNMAKGVTELPYDIAGAPVDIATMLMRPFGYSTEKPVMGSDFIKEKMTKLGVRPEPPADPTAKGFYTAGELLSNLTNPAAVSRKVGPAVEKGVKAGAMEVGRQLDRAILDDAGPLSKFVPQSAKPLYAVRPTGSTVMTGRIGLEPNVSEIDKLIYTGMDNSFSVAGQDVGQQKLIQDFWDKKARNYFTRQFGTPDDPIARGIASKQIKGTALEEKFPEYMLDQIAAGKTRVKEGTRPEGFVGPGSPESRFFPTYPRAMEDFTKRYDEATNLKGNVISQDPAAADPGYNLMSSKGRDIARMAGDLEADKLIGQGVRPELINTETGTVARSVKDKDRILNDGSNSAKELFLAFEESAAYNKLTPEQKTAWANDQFGKGRIQLGGMDEAAVGKNLLGENIRTAIEKGEPVYDFNYLGKPLKAAFNPASINKYLASLPPRELANVRFEDAVRGGLKMSDKAAQLENVVDRIKSGKPVADAVFSKGVSAPLLQFDEGPLKGFAWKRIEKRESTVPEGAYVGHSVGGYETGSAGYTADKREGFNTGKWQVYTLRDNRNRPVNTIEVQMVDEFTPVVMQIKGNGRATGNTTPEKYDTAVLKFFQDYLRPAAVQEKDEYLTPLLKTYKEGVNSTFKMP